MKRHIIIASHCTLASGLAETIQFFSGPQKNISVVSAYLDNTSINQLVADTMSQFSPDDEVVILSDLLAGSVNQQFSLELSRAHTHLIAGFNLALGLAIVLEPTTEYLTSERIEGLVGSAQAQIVYVNEFSSQEEDDE